MSERAAPMSSPCKPHKLIANSPSYTCYFLVLTLRPHRLGRLAPLSGERRNLAPHTLIHNRVPACVQTFSTSFLPILFSSLPVFLPSKRQQEHKLRLKMSLAPSIPSIKMKVGRVAPPPAHRACRSFAVIRSSKAEGPRRPAAPPLSPPPPMPPKTPALSTPPTLSQPPTPVKPAAPAPSPPETKPAAQVAAGPPPVGGVVTFEYQRKVAKELQDYFKKKKLEETNQGPFFGWLAKNEIANGRWAMFGFAVGMLTEYATGSDFVEQMKILLSNFGIVDLD